MELFFYFSGILRLEFEFFTHPPKNDRQTFALKSNSVELSSEFKCYFQRANQMQELELEDPIPIATPNANFFHVANGSSGNLVKTGLLKFEIRETDSSFNLLGFRTRKTLGLVLSRFYPSVNSCKQPWLLI